MLDRRVQRMVRIESVIISVARHGTGMWSAASRPALRALELVDAADELLVGHAGAGVLKSVGSSPV